MNYKNILVQDPFVEFYPELHKYYDLKRKCYVARSVSDVIKTNNKAVKAFDGIEVYDIIFKENIMYASCINGIYKIDILNEEVVQVTDKGLRRIEIFENSIIGNDRNLWIINLANGKERKIATNIVNFSLFENHIWINKKNKAVL